MYKRTEVIAGRVADDMDHPEGTRPIPLHGHVDRLTTAPTHDWFTVEYLVRLVAVCLTVTVIFIIFWN